eukprot:scaffold18907_cov90-Amphora_coffeaeformis.AAC.1
MVTGRRWVQAIGRGRSVAVDGRWSVTIIAGVGDGAGQADGFKWGGGVVELDEGFDAVGVGSGEGLVEGVEATVEAGAGVEQDRQ